MNKQDLSNQTKVPANAIDSILEAMGISKDLPDYIDEHLKLVQAVRDIHKERGLKSWVEAVGIYRKPLREAQLKEIAVRYSIAPEKIPEMLTAMKIKIEMLADSQIQSFEEVCQCLQANQTLEQALQTVADKAMAQKAQTKSTVIDANESNTDAVTSERSTLMIQQRADLAKTLGQALTQRFGKDVASEVHLQSYENLIDEIANLMQTNDPTKLLSEAYIIAEEGLKSLFVNRFATAFLSRPVSCTVDEVMARVDEIRAERRRTQEN